MLFQVNSG